MSDTQVAPTAQPSPPDPNVAWHAWNYQGAPNEPVISVEFPMPMLPLDAANHIALGLGLETLPEGYTLEHPEPVEPDQEISEQSTEEPQAPAPEEPTPEAPPSDPVPEEAPAP